MRLIGVIAICGLALSGGCRSQQPVDDAAISRAVKAKLAAAFGPIEAREVKQFDRGANQETITYISVTSDHGVVTLSGEVGSKRAKQRAADIAHGVRQVVKVNNNLALAPGYSDDAVGEK